LVGNLWFHWHNLREKGEREKIPSIKKKKRPGRKRTNYEFWHNAYSRRKRKKEKGGGLSGKGPPPSIDPLLVPWGGGKRNDDEKESGDSLADRRRW